MVIGAAENPANLDVFGNTAVTGKLTASGGLTTNIDGLKSKVNDSIIAQIKYDEEEGWQAGTEGELKTICFKEDINNLDGILSEISVRQTSDGSRTITDLKADYTNIDGVLFANQGLTADADVKVNGKITVSNGIEMIASDGKVVRLTVIKTDSSYEISLTAV